MPWTPAHSRALTQHPLIALNFHHIAPANRAAAGRQIRAAAAAGIGFDLDASPAGGSEPDPPRVLVAFYDGLADTGRFGAELCAELGLRAYFFPIEAPVHGHPVFDDDQLAAIGAAHEIGFHTAGHAAAAEITAATLEAEVRAPYARIRAVTGRAPRIAAWRGGTRFDPALLGNRVLRELGVTHLVSNWSVETLAAEVIPSAAGLTHGRLS